MDIFIGILIILIGIELNHKPRFDFTSDKKLLLWYGKANRKFLVVCKF